MRSLKKILSKESEASHQTLLIATSTRHLSCRLFSTSVEIILELLPLTTTMCLHTTRKGSRRKRPTTTSINLQVFLTKTSQHQQSNTQLITKKTLLLKLKGNSFTLTNTKATMNCLQEADLKDIWITTMKILSMWMLKRMVWTNRKRWRE